MTQTLTRPQELARIRIPTLAIAGIALILLILGGIWKPDQFFVSWLFAWIFWLGVSLGAMAIIMLHHLTGGAWGYMIRRFGETATLCLPIMLLLFVPLIFGVRHIYPWANPAKVAADAALRHQANWLNLPAWSARSIAFLLIWIAMAFLLRTDALARPGIDAVPIYARLRRVSAGGMLIYFITMSIASVDWIMSLEPHWFSTIFGFIVCISQSVSGCCLLILMLWIFHEEEPLKRVIHPNYLNDLGNVLLTFVILWAYLSFGQFLITWVGNSQDEITWYIRRTDGGWRWVAAALIAFHFLVPFIILLQRPLKRKMGRLALIALGVFLIHVIDELYWVTPGGPQFHGVGRWFLSEAMNLLAFVVVGGSWIATFLWILDGKSLLPEGERIPVIAVDHGHGQRPTPGAFD